MSKDLFFEMRSANYDSTFTKKEATQRGVELIKSSLDSGEIDKMELYANIARLSEVLNSALSTCRSEIYITEKTKVYGVEFTPVNGGESLNYKDDPVYLEMFEKLKNREDLLKLAYKSKDEIYDSEGVEVPKVSGTPRKSSVTIKF